MLHTRSFILLPSSAAEKCLEKASNSSQHLFLSQAFSGPPRLSLDAKVRALRLATEGKFRVLVSRNHHPSSTHNPDEIQADERAAKAYVSLVEEELKWVDFGDGSEFECSSSRKQRNLSEPLSEEEEIEEDRRDLARQNRFHSILKQAVSRWEMDSDWERNQRINGKAPGSLLMSDRQSCGQNRNSHWSAISGWLDRIASGSSESSSIQKGRTEYKA